MKAKLRAAGNDGTTHYAAGATCERDSEWLRRQIINGLAEPEDEAAKAIAANKEHRARYAVPALSARAKELGVAKKQIPALN